MGDSIESPEDLYEVPEDQQADVDDDDAGGVGGDDELDEAALAEVETSPLPSLPKE